MASRKTFLASFTIDQDDSRNSAAITMATARFGHRVPVHTTKAVAITTATIADRIVANAQTSSGFDKAPLEAHFPLLDAQWASGRHNGAELWRGLKINGYRSSLHAVADEQRGAATESEPAPSILSPRRDHP